MGADRPGDPGRAVSMTMAMTSRGRRAASRGHWSMSPGQVHDPERNPSHARNTIAH